MTIYVHEGAAFLFDFSVCSGLSCHAHNSRRGFWSTVSNLTLFFRELFHNRISAFFAVDVIVSAIVLVLFIHSEGKRLRMQLLWLPTIGTLIVGVSFGLPLFLFLRQLLLDELLQA